MTIRRKQTDQPEPETQTFASDRHDGVGGDRFDFDVSLDELVVVGACGKGAGGMVQKVVHVPTGVFLAVKIVQMNVQAEIRKNIIGELRALHSTRCPYVVAYRGAFFGDGSVSIVLEYADGGSVGDVTRKLGFHRRTAFTRDCASDASRLGVPALREKNRPPRRETE
jgi:hypothetical protein